MSPRRPQEAQNEPQETQESQNEPKMSPRRPEMSPRRLIKISSRISRHSLDILKDFQAKGRDRSAPSSNRPASPRSGRARA